MAPGSGVDRHAGGSTTQPIAAVVVPVVKAAGVINTQQLFAVNIIRTAAHGEKGTASAGGLDPGSKGHLLVRGRGEARPVDETRNAIKGEGAIGHSIAAGGQRYQALSKACRGHRLVNLRCALPEELADSTAATFIKLNLEVVTPPAYEGDGACVYGGTVVGPVVDEQLIVHPDANAVVGHRTERVPLRVTRCHPAGPTHRKVVIGNAGRRRAVRPVKIDVGIGTAQQLGTEVDTVEILGLQTARPYHKVLCLARGIVPVAVKAVGSQQRRVRIAGQQGGSAPAGGGAVSQLPVGV